MIEEKNIEINHSSTAFFTTAKKNYLYYILHQKNIPNPDTVSIASEKAARNIENELKPHIIGRRIEELEETEKQKLETVEEIQQFAEGIEYEEDILLFHHYNSEDKYRCLFVDGQIVSLKDDSDTWKFTKENPKYSNISDSQEEIVQNACSSIGIKVAEVLIRGEEVYDINPNPDLNFYSDNAGKDIFEAISDSLKGE